MRQSPEAMPTGLSMLPSHGPVRPLLHLARHLVLGSPQHPHPHWGRVEMLLGSHWLQELAPEWAEALHLGPGSLCQLQSCWRRQNLKVNIPIQTLLSTTCGHLKHKPRATGYLWAIHSNLCPPYTWGNRGPVKGRPAQDCRVHSLSSVLSGPKP